MNILFIYPSFPQKIWSINHFIKSFSPKAEFPPIELLKASILFPLNWNIKLIDLNSEKLSRKDIAAADYVFISANKRQINSAERTIARCKTLGKKIIASGMLFKENQEKYAGLDYLILDDSDAVLETLVYDLQNGQAKKQYYSPKYIFPKRKLTPDYSLANLVNYFSQNIVLTYD
jgi:hypothetical protein